MTKGKKVFLKYNMGKNEHEQAASAYVYLKNKTFVNAHLIKSGLVELDHTLDHPYREKFKKLYDEAVKERG
jgi:site-specific DNA-methyltransferase (adenine-specific)